MRRGLPSMPVEMAPAYTETTMKIGMNTRVSSRSLDVAVVAQKAEALGFESLWLPEHGVMPVHVTTRYQGSTDGNIRYDTGFAVVAEVDGKKLADVAGATGVVFNQPRGLTYKAFGYPAAAPFTGKTLVSCYGKAGNDALNPQFETQGIPCDMTGGSSGGPWFLSDGTDSPLGFQNSVNSYGYGSRSTAMYSPYWGSVIQQVYDRAAAAR